jgi:hypothetical protein
MGASSRVRGQGGGKKIKDLGDFLICTLPPESVALLNVTSVSKVAKPVCIHSFVIFFSPFLGIYARKFNVFAYIISPLVCLFIPLFISHDLFIYCIMPIFAYVARNELGIRIITFKVPGIY